jgi:hypothetical protein
MATAELKFNGTTIITETAGVANLQNINDINPSNLKFNTTNHEFTIKGVDAPIVGANYSTNDDANSGQLAIYNGTTKLWGINESGWIQQPNIPAFKFGITNDTNTGTTRRMGPNVTLLTTRDSFNNGNHFNTSDGRFTSPIDGYYYFNFVIMRNSSNGTMVDAQIVKNEPNAIGENSSSTFGRLYRGSYTSNYEQNNVQIITFLNAGDYVAFDMTGGSIYDDDSYIEGYLIG